MKCPSTEQLEAVARLQHQSDFSSFIAWLSDALSDIRAENDIQPNEAILRQGQGKAQTLATILKTVSTADSAARAAASRRGATRGIPAYTPTP